MTVDPDVQALLDAIERTGAPSVAALPPVEARLAFDKMLSSVPPSSAPVARVTDTSVAGAEASFPVRIYVPQGSGPFPVLAYFHGGGWTIGNIGNYDPLCRELCAAVGCVVVSVEYRLAPEHKFPAATDDCLAAVRWIAANIAGHGGDPARIAVAGDSAGGNLAAVTTQRVRDEGGPRLCAQLLIYPAVDHYSAGFPSATENATGFLLTRDDMEKFYGHYLRSDADIADPRACPLRATDFSRLPPALILTAEKDPLRDEGEAYGKALAAAGVAAEVKRYNRTIHGVMMLYPLFVSGRAMLDDSCRWLRERLA